ncbi:NACHT domain-containing NTPase [Glycomyces sp. YM15]|uniref:NACHT domain-containing protein n=1 Tax=Glycomyces sp. YM15 TaxID=2800446 RepID=UPI001963E5EA|nr:AAA family ATPase [Glycomyces sp. YM15]
MPKNPNDSARVAFATAVRRAHRRTARTLKETAERSRVAAATWSATMNGKTFPEQSWDRMTDFFTAEGLGATVVDLNELFKAAAEERRKPPTRRRPKPGPRMRRTMLASLDHITAFELPVVDRLDVLPAGLHTPRAEPRNVTFLVGEGGLGKSVLLKQLGDRLAAAEEGAAVVGVACNRVEAVADLTTARAADTALAQAAGAPNPADGLTGLVQRLRHEHGSVHLLIDTIDLIATDESAKPLSSLLMDLAKDAQVLVTCRKQEYQNLLDPLSTGVWHKAIKPHPVEMPGLTGDEILEWAERYVNGLDRSRLERERFLESLADSVKARTVKEICRVPLRLALACVLYSKDETLPSDLTITGLYEAYWEQCVSRDREGRRTRAAEMQEAGAFALAEQILQRSGERLSLSAAVKGPEHREGLKSLASEGIVQIRSGRQEFFHQTYAEFAVAKLLADHGEPEQLEWLRASLDDPTSHWWPVSRHLLLQKEVGADRYQDLVEAVPLLTGEGPQIHILSSQTRSLPDRLRTVAASVEGTSASHLHSLIHLFAEAPPDCAAEALDIGIAALEKCDVRVITEIAQTIGLLLPKLKSVSPDSHLSLALDRIAQRRDGLENDLRTGLLAHLVRPVCETAFDAALFELMCANYDDLGTSAQMVLLRAALRHRDSTPDLIGTLAGPMLTTPRPPKLREEEFVELLRWCWEHEATRASHGWDTWRDLLDAELADRWDSAQIRLVFALCDDPGTRANLLQERLTEASPKFPRRWIDVALYVAEDDPETVYELLKGLKWPAGRKAVGSAAALGEQIAKHLEEAERREVITALRTVADVDPRRIWPTLIVLAGPYAALHDDLMTDFIEYDRALSSGDNPEAWRSIRISPINTWLNDAPAAFLMKRRKDFRKLLPASGREFTQRRSHFEGRIAVLDSDARDWLTEQALRGPSAKAAYKGVQAAVAPIEQGATVMSPELCEWAWRLLRSPHSEVVAKLAGLLADTDLTPDNVIAPLAALSIGVGVGVGASGERTDDELLATTVNRLLAAVEQGEKSDVVQELTTLVIRLGEHVEIAEEVVRAILSTTSASFRGAASSAQATTAEERSELGAAFNRWCTIVLKLALPRMPLLEVQSNVQALLIGWNNLDLGTTSNRSAAADVIRGLLDRSPDFKAWLEEELWPGSAWGTQRAIAEAAVAYDRRIAGNLARSLSQRTDCSHDVGLWIHSKLQR